MNPELVKRYKWFRQAGIGGIVGENARICLEYARAELIADKFNITVYWEFDDMSPCPEDWTDDQEYLKRWYSQPHTCEMCSIVDDNNNIVASLSGIYDADDNYARIVQAELLTESIGLNTLGYKLLINNYQE